MREIWKDIEGFEGYQVSNYGNVRSFWRKKHYPTGYGTYRYLSDRPSMLSQSDDGNGYMKVMLYSKETGKRYCRKVHTLVANAFLGPKPYPDATIDHIKSGREEKLNNRADNLRWMSRRENIQKAYADGMCDGRIARQNKAIICHDLWTGQYRYYSSIGEAAWDLDIDRSSISHVLRGDTRGVGHYYFEYADWEDRLLYECNEEYQLFPWL